MAGVSDDLLPAAKLRVMQIIAGALVMGVLIFLGIALYMVLVQNQGAGLRPAGDLPLITLVAAGMLVMNAPMAIVLPRNITQTALKRMAATAPTTPPGADVRDSAEAASALLLVRQTSLIVCLALFEGAAFLGVIAYLLEAQVGALAVVAVAVLLMLANFPTERRVRAWLELHLQRLTDLRQQAELQGP